MNSLQLPTLNADKVKLCNAFVTCLLPATITLDNGEATLPTATLRYCLDVPTDTQWPLSLYINLNGLWRIDFSNLDLLALRSEFGEWLASDSDNTFSQLPEELVQAALERLFQPVVQQVAKFFTIPVNYADPPQNQKLLFQENLCFVLQTNDQALTTLLRCSWQDRVTILPVLPRLAALPRRDVPLPTDSQLSLRIVLGKMTLAYKDVLSLGIGDVLFPEQLSLETVLLGLGKKWFQCSQDGGNVALQSICQEPPFSFSSQEGAMSQTASQDLELEISFELPRRQMALSECAALSPGYTFSLGAAVEQLPITVLAGGRPVAEGRLVDVGGIVGVQLTSTLNKQKAN